jgi:hypothetical protein
LGELQTRGEFCSPGEMGFGRVRSRGSQGLKGSQLKDRSKISDRGWRSQSNNGDLQARFTMVLSTGNDGV